jgi:hypothetical protein
MLAVMLIGVSPDKLQQGESVIREVIGIRLGEDFIVQ